jgi:hypothetical protein
MNDAIQPRRSGRERKQAESIYLDAKRNIAAERRKNAAQNGSKSAEISDRQVLLLLSLSEISFN